MPAHTIVGTFLKITMALGLVGIGEERRKGKYLLPSIETTMHVAKDVEDSLLDDIYGRCNDHVLHSSAP